MLGPVLASIHNLTFYQRLVTRLRAAVAAGRLAAVAADIHASVAPVDGSSAAD